MRGTFLPAFWMAMICLVGASTIARADETTGSISIAVSQPADQTSVIGVSGIPADAHGWTAHARGAQPVAIQGLPPGRYHVTVTLSDGSAATTNVSVGQGDIVALAIERARGPAAGPPVVRVVDRQHSSQGTYVDEREVRALPTGSGVSAWVDTLVPFVIADTVDTGGLQLGTNVRVGGRGASATDATVSLGPFVAERAPGDGNRLVFLPDPIAIDTWSVSSGIASAEIAGPGAAISVVPKRPGPTRLGSVDVAWTDPSMVSTNNPAGIPSIARADSWKSLGVSFGSPLNRQMGLFVAASLADMRKHERNIENLSRATVDSVLAHVTHNPTDRTQIAVIIGSQGVDRPYGEVSEFRDAGIGERDRLFQSQLRWEHQPAHGGRLTIAGGFERGVFTPSGVLPFGTAIDRAIDGLIPSPAGRTTADRAEARLAFGLQPRGGHALEFGVTAAHSTSEDHQIDTSSRAELVDGVPARVWIPRSAPGDSNRTANHFAAYVTDHFTPQAHLTFDLGVRAGRSSGNAAGGDEIAWNALLPRAAFRWSPGMATVYGGYGRYQSEVPPDLLAFGDPGEAVFDVYRWSDTNLNGRFDSGEGGVLVARSGHGRDVASIDPAVTAPYTDEFMIGIERRLGANVTVRAAQVHRVEQSIVRSVNVGAPLSSYVERLIPDRGVAYDSPDDDRMLAVYDRLPSSFGQDRYVLTNAPDEEAVHDGTEISWDWRSGHWWSSGMASSDDSFGFNANRGPGADENDQGSPGELLENPNAASYPRGHLFYDRSYVLKFDVGYQAPHDITIAAVARYQDGQPFSRMVVVPDLAQGAELVNAYAPGRTRFTFTSTLDARIEKGFALAGHRAAVRVEVYNLPNLGYEIEENPVSGPAFRNTTAVQPPRAIRVGFRIEF